MININGIVCLTVAVVFLFKPEASQLLHHARRKSLPEALLPISYASGHLCFTTTLPLAQGLKGTPQSRVTEYFR